MDTLLFLPRHCSNPRYVPTNLGSYCGKYLDKDSCLVSTASLCQLSQHLHDSFLSIMPVPWLCSLCSGITAEALASKNGYAHAVRPEELDDRCDLCLVFMWKAWSDFVANFLKRPAEIDAIPKTDLRRLRLSITVQDPCLSYLKLLSSKWPPGPDGSTEWHYELDDYCLLTPVGGLIITIFVSGIPPDQIARQPRQRATCLLFAHLGDPATNHGIPTVHPDLTSTRSPETFVFIKSCLYQCDLEHDCASVPGLDTPASHEGRSTTSPTLLPARLIYLSGSDESSVRLVQILDQDCPIYMTLSHCWGPNMPKKCLTTNFNFEQRLESLCVSILPPSFRDAIEITRRLGVHFLWIDTLCIVQDSEKDWAIESIKMGSIYRNSMLNIAASHAQNSFGGCFNQQSISRDRAAMASSHDLLFDDSIEITGMDSRGINTTLILYPQDHGAMLKNLNESPLEKRGWTFQERVLSPRTINFTSTQVIWECRNEYLFEDRIPWRATKAGSRPLSSVLRPRLEDFTKSSLTLFGHDEKAAHIANYWYLHVVAKQYTIRAFTKPSDRLIALAGIANVYKHLSKDRYVAGLWESSLAAGLGWFKSLSQPTRPGPPTGSRWPTWSWASHDDHVRFSFIDPDYLEVITDTYFKLIDTQLKYSTGHVNEFSPIVGGFITVMGCLVELVCEPGSFSYPDDMVYIPGSCSFLENWHEGWKGNCYPDNKWTEVQPKRVTGLVLGHRYVTEAQGDNFLLLEPYGARDSAYTRCGFAYVNYAVFFEGKWNLGKTIEQTAQIRAARKPQTIHLY